MFSLRSEEGEWVWIIGGDFFVGRKIADVALGNGSTAYCDQHAGDSVRACTGVRKSGGSEGLQKRKFVRFGH